MKIESTYLGDGVYASFDGYQIWLAVGDHRNQVVAIDPDVYEKLVKFVDNIPHLFAEMEMKNNENLSSTCKD